MFQYSIRPGDTIYKIAAQFNVPINAILAANPGLYPYNLLVGQVIFIPTSFPGYPIFPRRRRFPAQFRRFPSPGMGIPGTPGAFGMQPGVPGMQPGVPSAQPGTFGMQPEIPGGSVGRPGVTPST